MVLVAVVLPCGNFVGEYLLVGDAAIQTLRRENAGVRIRPCRAEAAVLRRVVPFEALDEPAASGAGKASRRNRGRIVDVEIILHQHRLSPHLENAYRTNP